MSTFNASPIWLATVTLRTKGEPRSRGSTHVRLGSRCRNYSSRIHDASRRDHRYLSFSFISFSLQHISYLTKLYASSLDAMSTRTSPQQLQYHMQSHTVIHMACRRHHLPHSVQPHAIPSTRFPKETVLWQVPMHALCTQLSNNFIQSQYPAEAPERYQHRIVCLSDRDALYAYPYTRILQR